MNKKAKNISLAAVLILLFIFAYNLFNSQSQASASTGETPWYVTLLFAWGPSIVFVILYIIFIRLMKKLLEKVERIAVALEKNTEKTL